MVLGRVVHYAVDAVLLSTVVAGVRRSSGFTSAPSPSPHLTLLTFAPRPDHRPDPSIISDPTARSVAESFLGVGETIFDMIQATAVNSSYFKRDAKSSR